MLQKLNLSRKQLWEHCILVSIAHAISMTRYPELDYEYSWDGINFNINNGSGCKATITFTKQAIIAVFQDKNYIGNVRNAHDYFIGAPESVIRIAEKEALQYVLEELNSVITPLITGAFWSIEEDIFSMHTLDELRKHDAYMILDDINLKNSLIEYYDLDDSEIKLMNYIFDKKVKCPDDAITLSEEYVKILSIKGSLDECILSFKEIGVFI